ncbi:MAG: OmpH family outer membrane protein [Halothiobacillaceae bacterium]|nr:OmpH family outer membrane protein [Halothiobacillaceae bacterium]
MKRVSLVAAALALTLSVPVFAKELKIGVVNSAVLLDRAPQAEAARKQLEREFSSREKEIVDAQKSAASLEEKLSRDGSTMTESERSRDERELNRRMRELQRLQTEFRDDLNLRKNEELSKLQRQIYDVILDMAKNDGYDLILSDGVVYAGKDVDVTELVLKRLESVPSRSK